MNGRLGRERVSLAEVVGDHIIHMDSSSRVEDQEYICRSFAYLPRRIGNGSNHMRA